MEHFFFLEVNIKKQSALFFKRHFRSQGIFDIFIWWTKLFSGPPKGPKSSIMVQVRKTWVGNGSCGSHSNNLMRPEEKAGGGVGADVLSFNSMPGTVLNTFHKL